MSYRRGYYLAAALLLFMAVSACRPETASPASPDPTDTRTPFAPLPADTTVTPTKTITPTPTITHTPTATYTPSVTPTPFTGGPDVFPANINPLTGEAVHVPVLLDRSPIMVKVSNFPRGLRPHSGLSWADLVFEYYIGAGATRFTALYYGENPPEAGPVRSARLIDAQLGNLYNSLLAFSGADPFVYDRVVTALGNRAVNEGPNTCPALCRTGSGDVNSVRAYPELLTEFAEVEHGVDSDRPELRGTKFDLLAPEGGQSGLVIRVNYSLSTISEWRYDETIGLYTRYIEQVDEDGNVSVVPLVDALTDEQLTTANVMVLFVETIQLRPTLHDFVLAGNTAGQRGLFFRDGQVYEIIWMSQGPNLPLQFYDLSGELMPLQIGNTWFHIVGINSRTTEDNPGRWSVTNFIP